MNSRDSPCSLPCSLPCSIGALIASAATDLRYDAELLVAAELKWSRAQVIAHSQDVLSAKQLCAISTQLDRRTSGEPLAYIFGRKAFYGLTLEVSADVLIPRPETELLVDTALAVAATDARVLDLGTGSGAIAISLKQERPDLVLSAVDVDPDALAIARRNAQGYGCEIDFFISDWFDNIEGRYDLILSNPPYIAIADPHLADLKFEPQNALVSGSDGLYDIRRIIADAHRHLRPGGRLLLEQGATQANAVHKLLEAQGYRKIETFADLAGHPRVTLGRLA